MSGQMTHQERTRAALSGEEVDRPPASMWRHFYGQEATPEGLAEAMLYFQRRFDWDFVKVNPRASYHAEAWGMTVRYEGDRSPRVVDTPVGSPGDWLRVESLDIGRGVLGDHLRALELVSRGLGRDVPFLMTVFNPVSIVARLAPSDATFLEHIRERPEMVRQALEAVTETFVRFSTACLDRGAAGVFFATTAWATTRGMTRDEYDLYARPYDLKLLSALPRTGFHVLHVCRDQNMLDALADYPVDAFNWDAGGEGNPTLAEGRAMVGGRAVIGGIPHDRALTQASPEELAAGVRGVREEMGDRGWMLGTGCTFPPETPDENVLAVRRAADE